MVGIVEFLNARIDEDQAIAQAAINPWRNPPIGDHSVWFHEGNGGKIMSGGAEGGKGAESITGEGGDVVNDEHGAHIARHDPARVLREVTAKRALIAPHTRDDWYELADETTGSCESCSSYCDEAGCRHVVRWPCATLKAIAAVYVDHPDYRTDW